MISISTRRDGDEDEQKKKLDTQRKTAIQEIFKQYDVEGIIQFSKLVTSPRQVGYALGVITDDVIEHKLLPHFLEAAENNHKVLASGFIYRRYHVNGWEWCDNIDKSEWTPSQIGCFLAFLPFAKEAWIRASEWLEGNQGEYWTRTAAYAYETDGDLSIAIEKLVEHGRPRAAINCLDRMRHANQSIDVDQCVRALRAACFSNEPTHAMDEYHIVELIKFLQSEPSVPQEKLWKVEWDYLSLLKSHGIGGSPKFLEKRLASEPEFFCEMIQLSYRSTKSKRPRNKSRTKAKNAWQLLHEWKTPPGKQEDGMFREEHFNDWLQRVKELCSESGHLEIALETIGEALIHTPSDPAGLWIHCAVATALNDHDSESMRVGFTIGTYNSRGVHSVDPTGNQEKELAMQFRSKAEDVENAGFQRFAGTLRELADTYDREARQIVNEHQRNDER